MLKRFEVRLNVGDGFTAVTVFGLDVQAAIAKGTRILWPDEAPTSDWYFSARPRFTSPRKD